MMLRTLSWCTKVPLVGWVNSGLPLESLVANQKSGSLELFSAAWCITSGIAVCGPELAAAGHAAVLADAHVIRADRDARRRAGLGLHDAAELPSAQSLAGEALSDRGRAAARKCSWR